MRNRLPAFVLALALAVPVAGAAQAQTVVLVRHAEKADPAAADPPLSAAGQARAQALADSLADAKVSTILVSSFQRTQQTAAPLAAASGAPARIVSLAKGLDAYVAETVALVRAAPAEATVVVVGHSNTVPALAQALGYAAAWPIADCRYDTLLVLRLGTPGAAAVNGRYGAESRC